MFYEQDDEFSSIEYISLRIIFQNVVGYYNDYKDNSKYVAKYSAKRMNFRLNDDSLDKVYDIFEHIEEKLEIGLNNFVYESRGEEYLKTIVSDEKCFRKNKDNKTNIIPNKNIKYNCRVLLQIQSVYYSMKDNDDIRYYPQVLLEQCGYRTFLIMYYFIQILNSQILNQILSQMIVTNLNKKLLKILCVMNKNNSLIINKSLIVCINNVLLGFYLCNFKRYEFAE